MADSTLRNIVKWPGRLISVNMSEKRIVIALENHDANLVVRGLSEIMLLQSTRYISERLQRLIFDVDLQIDCIYLDWRSICSEEPSDQCDNHELSVWARCYQEAKGLVEGEQYLKLQEKEERGKTHGSSEDEMVEAQRYEGEMPGQKGRSKESNQTQPSGSGLHHEDDEDGRLMLKAEYGRMKAIDSEESDDDVKGAEMVKKGFLTSASKAAEGYGSQSDDAE